MRARCATPISTALWIALAIGARSVRAQEPPPPPSNDQCIKAIQVFCGTPFSFTGTTKFAINHYGFEDEATSCTGHLADGLDVAYRFDTARGDTLIAEYTSETDGSIYLVRSCTFGSLDCLSGSDQYGPGGTEKLVWVFHESGPHYVILDSRGVDEGGAFTFTGSFRCPRPRNDHLGAAIAIPCGPFALGGRMNFATNDVDSAGGVVALGRDVAYRFNAMAGDSVFLTYRQFFADPVLFLLEDSDPSRCLVALDRGLGATPETLAYRFPHTGGYTLVLDSRQAASGDVFDLDGAYTCSGGVASVEGPGAEPALVRPVVGRGPFALSARFAVERWRVLDLLGRVRRSLPGDDSRWDGAGDDGRPSPPGVYVVEARGAGRVARATVILLR